jgi:hypothetical protein
MHARIGLLLLALSLPACGPGGADGDVGSAGPPGAPGTDGEDGTPGEEGEDGDDGDDGDDGEDGADGSAILSGTIDPGSSLSLTHGLGTGNLLYEAQFVKNDVVYDYSLYPLLFPPELGPALDIQDEVDIGDDVPAALLENNTIAILYTTFGRLNVTLVDSAGAEIVAPIDLGPHDGPMSIAALVGGGFVIAWGSEDAFTVAVLDDDAQVVGSTATVDAHALEDVQVAELTGGGFVVAYSHKDTSDSRRIAFEVHSDPDTVTAGPTFVRAEPGAFRQEFALTPLSAGGFGLMRSDDDDLGSLLVYGAYNAAGAALGEQLLIEDYSIEMDAALAPNGNVLLAFEYGGPDAMGYAVVDEGGSLLAGPTLLSALEPDAVAAGVFGDGDFALFVGEDDTNVMQMYVISSVDGSLRAPANIVGATSPNDGIRTVLPLDAGTVAVFEADYHNRNLAMTQVSKGYLELRRISDEEVQLVNFTPETLEATVAVHRTP